MNRYYMDAHGNAFAVRCNGIRYTDPTRQRIPADKALRALARMNLIPTYLPQGGSNLKRIA